MAAGKSSRMGCDKTLKQTAQGTFLELILEKLLPISHRIFLILGPNYSEVRSYLQLKNYDPVKVIPVFNEQNELGMFSSVHKGFQSVSGREMILLQQVDQPHVPLEVYRNLLSSIDEDHLIFQVAARVGEFLKPLHPILFSNQFRDILLSQDIQNNLNQVLIRYNDRRKLVGISHDSVFENINHPGDIKATEQ